MITFEGKNYLSAGPCITSRSSSRWGIFFGVQQRPFSNRITCLIPGVFLLVIIIRVGVLFLRLVAAIIIALVTTIAPQSPGMQVVGMKKKIVQDDLLRMTICPTGLFFPLLRRPARSFRTIRSLGFSRTGP